MSGQRVVAVCGRSEAVVLEELLRGPAGAEVVVAGEPTRAVELVAELAPDLLVIDLDADGVAAGGFELLAMLAPWTGGGSRLPVLGLTATPSPELRRRARDAGARDLAAKPLEPNELLMRVQNLLELRRLSARVEREAAALEARVRKRTEELERARLETLERLARAAEYRDDATYEHPQRVGRTSALLARELGLPEETAELVRLGAPLHDIGKIGVPDSILLKPGRLTAEEAELMRAHTLIGAEILSGSESPVLRLAEEIALTHHERWDGGGYPASLRGERIPLPGRLVAVADAFDALTHARPYAQAWPVAEAVAEIRRGGGRAFDPGVVAAFDALEHGALLRPVGELFPH